MFTAHFFSCLLHINWRLLNTFPVGGNDKDKLSAKAVEKQKKKTVTPFSWEVSVDSSVMTAGLENGSQQ